MNQWDNDREELLQHWKQLGFLYRVMFLILFPFISNKISFVYIFNRLFVSPEKMVKVKELHWDTNSRFLWRKL